MTFTCEVMTPMFLNGADGSKPELRAPSIKGALRFWWRAMNGHLPLKDIKEGNVVTQKGLQTVEGEIFGDTSKRSQVIIIVREQPDESNIEPNALLPHKSNSSRPPSYKIKTPIIIELKLVKTVKVDETESFDIEALKKLFTAVCVLGGLGKRSRRGFGSVTIKQIKQDNTSFEPYLMPHNIDDIFKLLPPQYFFKNEQTNRIESKFGRDEKYPFIKQIQIGRKQSSLTLKIADVTNRFHKDIRYANNYGASLGRAVGGRFASPIYVSTFVDVEGNNYPIITTLNTVPSKEPYNISIPLQEEFKNAIL